MPLQEIRAYTSPKLHKEHAPIKSTTALPCSVQQRIENMTCLVKLIKAMQTKPSNAKPDSLQGRGGLVVHLLGTGLQVSVRLDTVGVALGDKGDVLDVHPQHLTSRNVVGTAPLSNVAVAPAGCSLCGMVWVGQEGCVRGFGSQQGASKTEKVLSGRPPFLHTALILPHAQQQARVCRGSAAALTAANRSSGAMHPTTARNVK